MEKFKLKRLFEEHSLYSETIAYQTPSGVKFMKSDQLLKTILMMKGKALKDFYRSFVRNKSDRDELLMILSNLATQIAMNGYVFTDQ